MSSSDVSSLYCGCSWQMTAWSHAMASLCFAYVPCMSCKCVLNLFSHASISVFCAKCFCTRLGRSAATLAICRAGTIQTGSLHAGSVTSCFHLMKIPGSIRNTLTACTKCKCVIAGICMSACLSPSSLNAQVCAVWSI